MFTPLWDRKIKYYYQNKYWSTFFYFDSTLLQFLGTIFLRSFWHDINTDKWYGVYKYANILLCADLPFTTLEPHLGSISGAAALHQHVVSWGRWTTVNLNAARWWGVPMSFLHTVKDGCSFHAVALKTWVPHGAPNLQQVCVITVTSVT